jgi:CBS domain-containing protein/ribosome-associated translation inhibitor RaiA
MSRNVVSLSEDDTVARAFNLMNDKSINQIPVLDAKSEYVGMIFAKSLLSSSAQPSSKLKGYVTNTATLSPGEDVEKAAQMIISSGNRALPVVENRKLVGIVSETDLTLTSDFGHATVDQIMSGAIVIDEKTTLSDAVSKLRRYNISRLPVINSKGILVGTVGILDIGAIMMTTPRERTSKSAAISGGTASISSVKARDIMRRAASAERGTQLNSLVEHFRKNEEVIIVGEGGRPMGIVTPKDALEYVLPKKGGPTIHIAHLPDEADRAEINDQMTKFIKKIQGRLGDITSVIVYADKHKTRKYSLRTRVITSRGVIDAKAVGYDPISASKELVTRLDRRIKQQHGQKVDDRKHRETARRAVGSPGEASQDVAAGSEEE